MDASIGVGLILILVGLALIAFEIVHPGVFVLIPGMAVLVGGILYLFDLPLLVNTVYGPLLVVIAAIIAIAISLRYYQHMARPHRPMSTTIDTLQGERGLVISAVIPNTLRGKVRIRSEVWSARSDHPIPAGTMVEVRGGEGVSVWVEPVREPESLVHQSKG